MGVANFIGCNRLYSSKVRLIHLAELLLTFVEELECLDVVLKPCFFTVCSHEADSQTELCLINRTDTLKNWLAQVYVFDYVLVVLGGFV